MVQGSRRVLLAVGLVALGSGCASFSWFPKQSQPVAPPQTPPAANQPEEKRGFFAEILPASWFVAEGEPSEEQKARARARVHFSLAQAYEKKGELKQAEEAYENALRADPEFVPALLGLARVYQRTGRPDAALELYERLLELAPNNPSVWNDLGLCYRELGDLVEAERCLRKAVELDPMRDLYRSNLAQVLAALGYYQQAWEEFRRVVGPALAHYNVALVAYELGDQAAALRHATEALTLDENLQPARRLLERLSAPAVPEVDRQPKPVQLPQQAVDQHEPRAPSARVLGIQPAR